MRVAVLTLTRDRLAYTKHCFATLAHLAGCDYDHFVLDQGSTDGTGEWLLEQDELDVTLMHENIGVNQGLNLLLDEAFNPASYDVIAKFDNDCELVTPNALRDVCAIAHRWEAILSPRIHGLRNPPPTIGQVADETATVDLTAVVGGIFLAAPARIFADGYRHSEEAPPWGDDEGPLCAWWRKQGGVVGYVQGYDANHYLTTDGQVADIPAYFERRVREGGRPR